MIAHAAVESYNGAVFLSANVLDQSILVDGIADQSKKIGLYRIGHGNQR
jgi:hypothetical protein